MTRKQNAPEIRFEGFTDPWEQRKLGDCGSAYGGLSGKTKEDFGHGAAKFVPYTNVFDNPITDSNRLESIERDSKQNEVRYGDALFTVSSETPEEVGMSSVWLSDQPNVYLNSFCFGYRQDGSFDSRYLAYMLRSRGVRSDLTLLAQGISRFNISKNKVMELEVPYPGLKEQAQLGLFFERLDNLITLHQRKYDKLCTVKKSMLDKMFPKPGETEPEIRFEGFTDPWEQRKLGDCASFGGGHTPSMADSENYDGGNIPWVTSQDVKTHYLAETSTLITAKGARELTFYPVGSIAMVTRSGILRHTLPVAELHKPMVVNQDIRVIIPHKELSGQWLLQYLIGHERPLLLEYGKVGTTVESVDFSKMQGMTFPLPKMDEQCVIGAFFASIDNLITLHQRKLELLRNIKKSLLDRMFV